jgi:hypothetical protein
MSRENSSLLATMKRVPHGSQWMTLSEFSSETIAWSSTGKILELSCFEKSWALLVATDVESREDGDSAPDSRT